MHILLTNSLRVWKKKLFYIIQSIKVSYGDDVAIISCEELNKNHCGNCKKLVKENMNKTLDDERIKHGNTINSKYMKKSSDSIFTSENDKNKKKISIKEYLIGMKYPREKVNKICNNIKARVGNKTIIC